MSIFGDFRYISLIMRLITVIKIPAAISNAARLLALVAMAATCFIMPGVDAFCNDEPLAEAYVIGPEDVLNITVWDNPDLSGDVYVGLDGYLDYQFIGRVKASGLTAGELAASVTELLANGYVNHPNVAVQVRKYGSRKVFIIGEVNRPGTYYLTKRTTLVEAIAMAMGPTGEAGHEVLIVRSDGGHDGENIMVDLRRALEGDVKQNIYVHPSDSIFVPKAKTFTIMGEVKKPGQYPMEKDMTIRKALSIAGGNTERAAINRTAVVRIVNGEELEQAVELNEPVLPGDTIIVPQSYF